MSRRMFIADDEEHIIRSLPMLHCGGDYYAVIPLDFIRYLVLLGDVAGHGLKAAFITTILKKNIQRIYPGVQGG